MRFGSPAGLCRACDRNGYLFCGSDRNEVLISSATGEIPSEDPDTEISKIHSVYAWGVVFVIVNSAVFLF